MCEFKPEVKEVIKCRDNQPTPWKIQSAGAELDDVFMFVILPKSYTFPLTFLPVFLLETKCRGIGV